MKAGTMDPRLRELIDRLVAPGPGGRVGSASEGHELHDLVEHLQMERDAAAPVRKVRLPDADGWWARRRGGNPIKWFYVEMVSESGESPFAPHIYVSDFETLIEAAKFTSPLTDWYGPFSLPRDD